MTRLTLLVSMAAAAGLVSATPLKESKKSIIVGPPVKAPRPATIVGPPVKATRSVKKGKPTGYAAKRDADARIVVVTGTRFRTVTVDCTTTPRPKSPVKSTKKVTKKHSVTKKRTTTTKRRSTTKKPTTIKKYTTTKKSAKPTTTKKPVKPTTTKKAITSKKTTIKKTTAKKTTTKKAVTTRKTTSSSTIAGPIGYPTNPVTIIPSTRLPVVITTSKSITSAQPITTSEKAVTTTDGPIKYTTSTREQAITTQSTSICTTSTLLSSVKPTTLVKPTTQVKPTSPISSSTTTKCSSTVHSIPSTMTTKCSSTVKPIPSTTECTSTEAPVATKPAATTTTVPCAPQPDGYGPVPTPDTPEAFLAFPEFHAQASAAPATVSSDHKSFTKVFNDLDASILAKKYLTYRTLHSFDTQQCADFCAQTAGCEAFNLYVERNPSVNPSSSSSTDDESSFCPNPTSITNYKCALWGAAICADDAKNDGQWRGEFRVVITGSVGYNRS